MSLPAMPAAVPGDAEALPPALPLSDAQSARLVAYAAAIGRDFDFPLLVEALEADEERTVERIEGLIEDGLLRERPGGDRFGFVRDEDRGRAYRSLSPSRLRVIHRRIAEALERRNPEPSAEVVSELGRHYFLGRVPARSLEFNRRAAAQARDRGRPEVAAHHLERALIDARQLSGGPRSDVADLAAELGGIYQDLGERRSAERLYRDALRSAGERDPGRSARLHLALAQLAHGAGDPAAALVGAREAHQKFSQTGDLRGVASVHRLLGRIAFQRGAYREALDEAMRGLDLLAPAQEPAVVGQLMVDIGDAFRHLGPEVEEEAGEWYRRAIDRLRRTDAPAIASVAHRRLAEMEGSRSPRRGLELLDQAREAAERAHDSSEVARVLLDSVDLRLALGELEEAERENRHAAQLVGHADDPAGQVGVRLREGAIAERRGQWDEAERVYSSAAAEAGRLNLAAEGAEAEFALARLFYKTRDIPRARIAFDRAAAAGLTRLRPLLTQPMAELGRQLARAEPTPPDDDRPSAGSYPPAR